MSREQRDKGALIEDPDNETRRAELDSLFRALIFVDAAHHEVHEGDSFVTDFVDTIMALNDTLILAFKTPEGKKRVHMIIGFATLTGGHVDLIEGPTWDNQSGAQNAIFNRKREASMNSSILMEDQAQVPFLPSDNVILGPANLAGGTVIHDYYAFGAQSKLPAASRDIEEWILKPGTQYAVKFTADAANNKGHLILDWYEHTDQ